MEETTTAASGGAATGGQGGNASPFYQLAGLCNHPLVSAFAAAYVLAVLYLPRRLLPLFLSPVLLSALLLLLAVLLYLGGTSCPEDRSRIRLPAELRQPEREDSRQPRREQRRPRSFSPTAAEEENPAAAAVPCGARNPPSFDDKNRRLAEWPRWRPLDVIYEGYEGEDEDAENAVEELSLRCHSDTSDDGSAGDFACLTSSPVDGLPEDLFLLWEMEEGEGGGGLIEIPLEDLIEIDISGRT